MADVYPSLRSKGYPRDGRTPDQQDVYAAAAWLHQSELGGSLGSFLKPYLLPGEYAVTQVKGWILGVM